MIQFILFVQTLVGSIIVFWTAMFGLFCEFACFNILKLADFIRHSSTFALFNNNNKLKQGYSLISLTNGDISYCLMGDRSNHLIVFLSSVRFSSQVINDLV